MLVISISLVIYVVAGIMIYHNAYNLEQNKKVTLIICGFIVNLIITFIIVSIGVAGINAYNNNYAFIVKITPILIFAPINVIITIPYIANLLNKYKANKIDSNNLKRRIIILAILFIVIAIFEISYIKEFQIGLLQNVEKIK